MISVHARVGVGDRYLLQWETVKGRPNPKPRSQRSTGSRHTPRRRGGSGAVAYVDSPCCYGRARSVDQPNRSVGKTHRDLLCSTYVTHVTGSVQLHTKSPTGNSHPSGLSSRRPAILSAARHQRALISTPSSFNNRRFELF